MEVDGATFAALLGDLLGLVIVGGLFILVIWIFSSCLLAFLLRSSSRMLRDFFMRGLLLDEYVEVVVADLGTCGAFQIVL